MQIKILDKITINKIAAGEVIERPASVVKELVENSVDAGATKISIEVEEGGKKFIKVMDNGSGMAREDALLSFKKHATSKIESIEDLEKLRTLGFRGEALPSICACGNVELSTKAQNSELGTRIIIEDTEARSVEDITRSPGTTVVVSDLFSTTPARRKYLKTTRTELAHIVEQITRQALVHHRIYFRLVHNGREILCAPPTDNLLDTMINLYSKDLAKELIPIDYRDENLEIKGYLGKPSLSRASPDYQSIYVNRRWVRSKLINATIREAYSQYIPKKKYPVVVLLLKVDPSGIDINIHPTKRAVKFVEERKIYDSVLVGITSTLRSSMLAQKAKVGVAPRAIKKASELKPPPRVSLPSKPLEVERKLRISRSRLELREEKAVLPRIDVLCQVANTYIVGECEDGSMMLIDQHAAHERILYEQMRELCEKSTRRSRQKLITPRTIELPPKEREVLEQYRGALEELGFTIEAFGGAVYNVKAAPQVIGEVESINVIHRILEDLLSLGKVQASELHEKIASSVSCSSAIKAGYRVTKNQQKSLVAQLAHTHNPYTCPHGRPTLVYIDKKELEKKFKRR